MLLTFRLEKINVVDGKCQKFIEAEEALSSMYKYLMCSIIVIIIIIIVIVIIIAIIIAWEGSMGRSRQTLPVPTSEKASK